jgi:hypothetical protein
MWFIDTLGAEGHAVESIYRVLRQQGCQIGARTYRSWKQTTSDGSRLAARTVSDAHVVDAVRDRVSPRSVKTSPQKETPPRAGSMDLVRRATSAPPPSPAPIGKTDRALPAAPEGGPSPR